MKNILRCLSIFSIFVGNLNSQVIKSPWLEIDRQNWQSLNEDVDCEIAIIGGGISGVSTLYFLLTLTDKNVVLVEKNQIASGATGNNAGIAVAGIEKPIQELVSEWGPELTANTFDEMNDGWNLLFDILEKTNMHDYFFPVRRYVQGFSSLNLLLHALNQEQFNRNMDYRKYKYLVSDSLKGEISEELHQYIQFTSPEYILETLRCVDANYIAAKIPEQEVQAGRINTAKLCYQMLSYLEKQFPNRFSVYERTEITTIDISQLQINLQSNRGKIHTKDVILCTNGYKNFVIFDQEQKLKIDKLQSAMTSREGYLAGYLVPNNEIYSSGFIDDRALFKAPYFYLLQAPIAPKTNSLMVVGGPENDLHDDEPIKTYAQRHFEILQKFINNIYGIFRSDFDYFWGGIMGYTKTGLRWVGRDSEYTHLWYNLGCNGIGIIPAIAGAEKIANQFNGVTYAPSLFDPPQ